jgi:pilus assembly protein CpaB
MGRRTLLLIASILVAAVGTALIGLYVRDADSRAERNQSLTTVLVADQQINPGVAVNSLPSSYFRTEKVLRSSTQADVYRSLAEVNTEEKNRSTRITVLAGQQIVPAMFAASSTAGLSGLKEGHRGVAVELTDPARAAGLLTPGSKITIYTIPDGGQADVLLKEALVLGIGNQRRSSTDAEEESTPDSTEAPDDVPRAIVTLDLSIKGALLVVRAQAAGDLYFDVHGAG